MHILEKNCHLCFKLPFLQWNFLLHWYMCDIMWSLLPSLVFIYAMCIMECNVDRWNEEFDPSWQLTFGFFNIQDEKKSPLQLEATLLGFLVTNPWPCPIFIVVCCISIKKIILENHMLCTSTKTKLNLCSIWSMKSFWCEEVVTTFLDFL